MSFLSGDKEFKGVSEIDNSESPNLLQAGALKCINICTILFPSQWYLIVPQLQNSIVYRVCDPGMSINLCQAYLTAVHFQSIFNCRSINLLKFSSCDKPVGIDCMHSAVKLLAFKSRLPCLQHEQRWTFKSIHAFGVYLCSSQNHLDFYQKKTALAYPSYWLLRSYENTFFTSFSNLFTQFL